MKKLARRRERLRETCLQKDNSTGERNLHSGGLDLHVVDPGLPDIRERILMASLALKPRHLDSASVEDLHAMRSRLGKHDLEGIRADPSVRVLGNPNAGASKGRDTRIRTLMRG